MSSRGLPEVLMKKVDDYVDSLAPQIQPRITSELETFQQKTIDSLEGQVVEAFRSLFNNDKSSGGGSGGGGGSSTSRSPFNLSDSAPDSYGGQSLPFADEIASLTRSFGNITNDAGDDLREIFNLTEGNGGSRDSNSRSRGGGGDGGGSDFSRSAKGFLSAAVNAVQDHLDGDGKSSGGGQGGFQLDGLLGTISDTVKDAARNPEDKARLISPEIKEHVGAKLKEQHAPLAEQFTRIALDCIKRWLRGNTTTRDLGDGVRGEVEDQVKDLVKGLGGLFGNKKNDRSSSPSRGGDDRSRGRGDDDDDEKSGGFSSVISDKLSTGLARVHREVRLEFRKILGKIEKQLFELLPDQIQRPLEKVLGGNPFDSQLDRDAGATRGGQSDRGFRDDLKVRLLDKIRGLIRKVQETLRESILGVVNGGHRKFERESWMFVQVMVEQKVQRYLPKVKIEVPDDIGNEGVKVGAPTEGKMGGGNRRRSSSKERGDRRDSPRRHERGEEDRDRRDSRGDDGRRHDDRRDDDRRDSDRRDHGRDEYRRSSPPRQQGYEQAYRQDDYRQDHRDQRQDYRQEQYHAPPPGPPPGHQGYGPPLGHHQGYGPPPGSYHDQGYQQQGYQQSTWQGQNQRY